MKIFDLAAADEAAFGHGFVGQVEAHHAGFLIADLTSGLSFQKLAVSVSYRSRTTSQSSFASACRWNEAFWPPTAGFWPIAKKPLILPSDIATNIGMCEWSPMIFGAASRSRSRSSVVAASPNQALSWLTMNLGKLTQ